MDTFDLFNKLSNKLNETRGYDGKSQCRKIGCFLFDFCIGANDPGKFFIKYNLDSLS